MNERFFAANLALNKPASQISTYGAAGVDYVASHANDGSLDEPSCTNPGRNNSWWAVDLESPANIDRVNVTNDRNNYYCNYYRRIYCIH